MIDQMFEESEIFRIFCMGIDQLVCLVNERCIAEALLIELHRVWYTLVCTPSWVARLNRVGSRRLGYSWKWPKIRC